MKIFLLCYVIVAAIITLLGLTIGVLDISERSREMKILGAALTLLGIAMYIISSIIFSITIIHTI